jgi:hypothetical protein
MIRLVEASMKFSKILTVALVAGILSLNAQAQNAGPFLWSSYIGVVGSYLQPEGSAVSRFTPGAAITVTRFQLQAAQGSYIYPHSKCSYVPKLRVTDGTTKYEIAIPNWRQTGRFPLSVSADSGAINVGFPANANLRLVVIPGQKGCYPGGINVTVQYSVN